MERLEKKNSQSWVVTWMVESTSQSLWREHLGGRVGCTVWLTDSALNGPLPLRGVWTLTQFLVIVIRVEFATQRFALQRSCTDIPGPIFLVWAMTSGFYLNGHLDSLISIQCLNKGYFSGLSCVHTFLFRIPPSMAPTGPPVALGGPLLITPVWVANGVLLSAGCDNNLTPN